MQTTQTAIAHSKPHFSIPSIIAVAASIISFFVRPAAGVLLAIVAIFFGIIGLFLAFHPSIRGGIISFLSIMLAGVGIIVAIIREVI